MEIKALDQEPIDYKAQYEKFFKKTEIVISQLRADRDRLLDVLNKIRAEIEKLNPVDYSSIYSYESHYGAREMQNDVLEIINKYIEGENKK